MTDHIKNLQAVVTACNTIAQEIQTLENQLTIKKEIYLKYSGIIEYLQKTEAPTEPSTEVATSEINEATVDDQLPG